MEVDIIAGGL